jgi:hypothetical protein
VLKPTDKRKKLVCKIEWTYKPADGKTNETNGEIGPTRQDLKGQVRTAKVKVSYDREVGGNLPREMAPRHQERESGGGFERKNKSIRKRNMTYPERHEREILGGGPDEGHEAHLEPRIVWAHRPASGGNNNIAA